MDSKSRGIRAAASHSYLSLERVARIARRRLCPELEESAPLPNGARDIFERLETLFVGATPKETWFTYAVNDLAPGIEGQTAYRSDIGKIEVTLSPESYDQLEKHDPNGQRCVCHEVMHGFLHRDLLIRLAVLPHMAIALLRQENHPNDVDTEWQADTGAAAMIMPASGLEQLRKSGLLTTHKVMATFNVSEGTAETRIKIFIERRDELLAA